MIQLAFRPLRAAWHEGGLQASASGGIDARISAVRAASGASALWATVTQSRPPASAPTPAIHNAGRTDGSDATMGIEFFEPSDNPVDQPIPALAAELN